VPYPPNYGGAIDVFYKLKALSELGVEIILHTFEYRRDRQDELQKYCRKVYYYPRNSIFKSILSKLPFVVKSRMNKELIDNLKGDSFPILFEGIHTTYPLLNNDFENRITMVRMHNIEHDYYKGLAKSERSSVKKAFFNTEAKKLKNYEGILSKTNYILTISPYETDYYKNLFGDKVVYCPPFHENEKVTHLDKKGEFAFYHGDLKISDNYKAANFLIDVFATLDYPLVIGGSFYPKDLQEKISKNPNCSFVDISNGNNLKNLFSKAHINVLLSFQKTGIKLKLINALYQSRFVIGNDAILADTGFEDFCTIANSKSEFKKAIEKVMKTPYKEEDITVKEETLKAFDVLENAKKILALL
jgi:hypothetical protein